MTGYGRSSRETPWGRLVIEIHSVNKKFLDLSIYLPKDLLRFDIEIRKWLSEQIERGQVSVRANLQIDVQGRKAFDAKLKELQTTKRAWEEIASHLGFDPRQDIDLKFLVDQAQAESPLASDLDEHVMRHQLKEGIEEALEKFISMKEEEGRALADDMEKRLSEITPLLKKTEEKKEGALAHYQAKLRERLQEVGPLTSDVEGRLHREIALLAEKADITEEVVRANSHIRQFQHHLKTAERAIGRTLDFLLQEMNREINTLAAKSLDIEISGFVVKMKSELEKIREQVQNIE
jgi:uncharacterized protein (TIGR00255 family)